MFKVKQLGLVLSLIFTIQACSSLRMLNPFQDKISFVDPPKDLSLSKSEVVSIKQGQDQSSLNSQVKSLLSKANAGGAPYFKSVAVGSLSAEQDLSKAALIDISIQNSQVFDTPTQETRTQCPGKKLVNTCSNDEAHFYKVSCVKRTAEFTATLVVSTGDGNSVLTTKNATGTSESSLCSDRSGTLDSKTSLLKKAQTTVASKLIEDLIPTHKQRPSDLIDESDEVVGADAELLLSGAKLAADNNLLKAGNIYQDLSNRYPQHAGLAFNLAYIQHALGNYGLAADAYSKALQLAGDPDVSEDFAEYAKEVQAWLDKSVLQVKK